MKHFIIHNRKYIYGFSFIFICGLVFTMHQLWDKPVINYSENFIVSIIIGFLFAFIPLLIGLDIGRKTKSRLVYYQLKEILEKISTQNDFNDPKRQNETQELVMTIGQVFKDDINENSWIQSIIKKNIEQTIESTDCGVCGKKVDKIDEKCSNCPLNCFAWEKTNKKVN